MYQLMNNIDLSEFKPARTPNRKLALQNGEGIYIGNKCKYGHEGGRRYTGSGQCTECVRLKYVPTGRKKGRDLDPARLAAKEAGKIYYISGRACMRGHVGKRRTFNGACQECADLVPKELTHDYSLRTKYKINMSQYNEMYKSQEGKCKICEKPETSIDKQTRTTKKLSVDHCHETKKVRGLLCHRCNVGIGLLKHNPELIRKAALYCE